MNIRRLFLYILFPLSIAAVSADDGLLSGTPIGSVSVNYATGDSSRTVNTPANAFDGDLSTIYASYERSYTWVGLDLGKQYVITAIGFASRAGWPQRLTLGIFEGGNNPDFSDAVPLYMIKEQPESNVLTKVAVNVSRGFRYVRYVGPNNVRCNIAEVQFYGHEGEGDDSQFYTPTNLPLLTIHTDSAKEITSKAVGAILTLVGSVIAAVAGVLGLLGKKTKVSGVMALVGAAAAAVGVILSLNAGMTFSEIAGAAAPTLFTAAGASTAVAGVAQSVPAIMAKPAVPKA